MKPLLLVTGLILLFAIEILRVYFIMPFPGSQQSDTISIAYWLGRNITWLRIIALLLVIFPAISIYRNGRTWAKVVVALFLVTYGVIFFFVNFRFEADKMFHQPEQKKFSSGSTNKINGDKLIIGVAINGEAKAYPIQLIGYHHQVRDSIGNTPVMITYCTVCRSGRAFSPAINGKIETFRLVGMDHFNAMFEDETTKSWWQQATGVSIAGPLKGTALKELPSVQTSLNSWLTQYPKSLVMQPDNAFAKEYEQMAKYDRGNGKSSLTKRDSASWKPKSWIIGISHEKVSKAYDWNELVNKRMISDSIPGLPVVLTLENDTASFHVFDRTIKGKVLNFQKSGVDQLTDSDGSTWNLSGESIDGVNKGEKLRRVQAYQEFWHSWQTFHKGTLR
ncbi:MAG: DUF3179 domain-containing protein [Chitinophagaceae bacterium]|nr:DUF3179 domain-containing protein [Chitinophagaceae bacterium]